MITLYVVELRANQEGSFCVHILTNTTVLYCATMTTILFCFV